MGVGIALYAVASLYEWGSKDSIIKCTVKCKYCRKRISEKVRQFTKAFPPPIPADFEQAKRCVNCTSWTDGRENR